ncbi:3-oxoacyl-(acyl carrier protein) synthase III [Salinisphaera sp. PC39]|uniref:beta-ketoacyl-ACP synthase III n=1 Tax=Salinisphaera sp. PC39 TaxID=1304156 RepID=UPI00333F95CC
MKNAVITGTGLYTPPEAISNDELVAAFNQYVEHYNAENADAIAAGELEPLQPSDSDFIYKASGIRSRYVMEKGGILDPERMRPRFRTRGNDEPSLMCEMSLAAIDECLANAGREPGDVDAVITACSNLPRPYPALAVEIQEYLGGGVFGFDMNVACASAAFGLQTAANMIAGGSARRVLMVNPEICSAHLNFRDRDSHFIFGDVCTAALVEAEDVADGGFEILGTRLKTKFSNNIRNNFGFLNPSEEPQRSNADRRFVQNGRRVFKDVGPMVAELITGHVNDLGLAAGDIKRLWLHQANINMNSLIARRVLGRDPETGEMPSVLDEYANTSSASPVIVFHKYHDDLASGDVAVLCGFGAGYSAGSVVLRRN